MHLSHSLPLLGFLACAFHAAGLLAQDPSDPQATFASRVEIVLHPVAVLDANGDAVLGLGRDDFAIYEDEERQDLSVFLTPDANPFDIALVADTSASLAHYARPVRLAAKSFLGQLHPLDCVYLLPFNDEVGPGVWDRGLLLPPRVEGMFMHGGTALYDALIHGMQVLRRDAPAEPSGSGCGGDLAGPRALERRRAVVLLTDGSDADSQHRYDEVLDLARASAIPIFPVVHGDARNDARLRQILQRLAGETGGAVVDANGPVAIEQAFAEVIVLLRASYLLGYRPPDESEGPPRQRAVRVRSRPAFRLIHSPTYWR